MGMYRNSNCCFSLSISACFTITCMAIWLAFNCYERNIQRLEVPFCILICWFHFYALAQESACKSTKKLIDLRGPSVDWSQYPQTEATPPATTFVSCHTSYVKSNTIPMTWPKRCWQLIISMEYTMSISTRVCWFELCLGTGDVLIYWFNGDVLAQEYAYRPAKEPMNYLGLSGDWTRHLWTEAIPPISSCPSHSWDNMVTPL